MDPRPSLELEHLAQELEAGNIPSNAETVKKLKHLAQRVKFLEDLIIRHVRDLGGA